jgi:hypothetical protein
MKESLSVVDLGADHLEEAVDGEEADLEVENGDEGGVAQGVFPEAEDHAVNLEDNKGFLSKNRPEVLRNKDYYL